MYVFDSIGLVLGKSARMCEIPNRHVRLGWEIYKVGKEQIPKFDALVEEPFTWIDESLASIRQELAT